MILQLWNNNIIIPFKPSYSHSETECIKVTNIEKTPNTQKMSFFLSILYFALKGFSSIQYRNKKSDWHKKVKTLFITKIVRMSVSNKSPSWIFNFISLQKRSRESACQNMPQSIWGKRSFRFINDFLCWEGSSLKSFSIWNLIEKKSAVFKLV